MAKKDSSNQLSVVFMALAVGAVVMAGIGYTGNDIWLASTQWLLVATVSGIFGVYLK